MGKQRVRLGIFGGSFDPVHIGHLTAARNCLDQARLDRVIFVPAGVSPFKQDSPPSPGPPRVAMLRLALAHEPRFEVSTDELDRGGVSYTVDTLERLHARHPNETLVLLLGPDALAQLPGWHAPKRILELAEIVAIERQGVDDLVRLRAEHPDLEQLFGRERLDGVIASRVRMPPVEARATTIRRAIAAGQPIDALTPAAVADYIHAHRLYADAAADRAGLSDSVNSDRPS